MADKTIKPPTNRNEEAALEKALASYKLTRIDAVEEFLNGDVVKAFREEVDALMKEGLPAGSSAYGHISQLGGFLDRTVAGLTMDRQSLEKLADPGMTEPSPELLAGAHAPPPPVPLV